MAKNTTCLLLHGSMTGKRQHVLNNQKYATTIHDFNALFFYGGKDPQDTACFQLNPEVVFVVTHGI
jgi:hypothetical protein